MKKYFYAVMAVIAAMSLSSCGYNAKQDYDARIDEAKAQVLVVGKKRLDTVDNIVAVTKGYATHEKGTLVEVTGLRAKVGSVNVNAKDQKSVDSFLANQDKMNGAIGRLLVSNEAYPNLKADQHYLQLMRDLKRLDREMAEARTDYNRIVRKHNSMITRFPYNLTGMMFGWEKQEYLKAAEEKDVADAPKVKM